MRVFFAILFDDEVKTELQKAQVPFRLNRQRGNFTSIDNLHLTLAFIGEVTGHELDRLEDLLDDLDQDPFDLTLGALGSFSSKDGAIWWVGIKPHPQLIALQSKLVKALRDADLSFDDKPYKPHVTLVRSFKPARPDQTIHLPSVAPLTINVKAVSLMRSERIHDELTYTELARKDLTR